MDATSLLQAPALVKCFRHEGADCPRCDGSGYRPRSKRCAGCSQPTGRPSEGGKALRPKRTAKSWEEARSLPLYCVDCNPRSFWVGQVTSMLERMGADVPPPPTIVDKIVRMKP